MMISFILHTVQFMLPLPYHAIQKYNLLFMHIRGVYYHVGYFAHF